MEWFHTMQEARSLPVKNVEKLRTPELLEFCRKHVRLLTSETFWQSKVAGVYYGEYFSVLASVGALSDVMLKMDNKIRITPQDILLVEKTIKVTGGMELDIDPDQSDSKIFGDLCIAVATHHLNNKDININDDERAALKNKLADSANPKRYEEDTEAARAKAACSVMHSLFKKMIETVSLGFGREEFLRSMKDAYDLSIEQTE